MNKTCYLQTDGRWGGLLYPRVPWYIRNCGCGEVAIANILIELKAYEKYTPKTIQPYCKQYAAPNGDGTYWSGIPAMMKHYGLSGVKECATFPPLWKEMAKGNRVCVLLMGSKDGGSKGVHWTSGGHYVCAVAYKKEKGKHYIYVKDSASTSKLRNGWISYEENIRGDCLKIWVGTLVGALYGETTVSTEKDTQKPNKLVVDGIGGKATIKASQKYLGTTADGEISGQNKKQSKYYPSIHAVKFGKGGSAFVKALQRFLCMTEDGELGKGTIAAWQNFLKKNGYYTHKIDGVFGVNSMEAWQKFLNAHWGEKAIMPPKIEPEKTDTPVVTTTASKAKTTAAKKIVARAKKFCWKYGTKKSKYAYKTGKAKSAYKTALKKWFKKKAKISQTDCGYFVGTCVRAAGVSKSFKALPASAKDKYPAVPKTMKVVWKGKKIPSGLLQAGDIIVYRKINGGQHALMYYSKGKIAEAQRGHAFPAIKKDTKKYNASNVKKSSIRVLRAR